MGRLGPQLRMHRRAVVRSCFHGTRPRIVCRRLLCIVWGETGAPSLGRLRLLRRLPRVPTRPRQQARHVVAGPPDLLLLTHGAVVLLASVVASTVAVVLGLVGQLGTGDRQVATHPAPITPTVTMATMACPLPCRSSRCHPREVTAPPTAAACLVTPATPQPRAAPTCRASPARGVQGAARGFVRVLHRAWAPRATRRASMAARPRTHGLRLHDRLCPSGGHHATAHGHRLPGTPLAPARDPESETSLLCCSGK